MEKEKKLRNIFLSLALFLTMGQPTHSVPCTCESLESCFNVACLLFGAMAPLGCNPSLGAAPTRAAVCFCKTTDMKLCKNWEELKNCPVPKPGIVEDALKNKCP